MQRRMVTIWNDRKDDKTRFLFIRRHKTAFGRSLRYTSQVGYIAVENAHNLFLVSNPQLKQKQSEMVSYMVGFVTV